MKLQRPAGAAARSPEEAEQVASKIGYPVLVRPSYVLGGRAMKIVRGETELRDYMRFAVDASPEHPVLIDRFLSDAIEVDADVICDGTDVVVAGLMEHIEEAGVHSGDSACSLPPYSLDQGAIDEIMESARKLALELGVRGLMNAQFAVREAEVFVIEVNPRASRTVPFVSKAIGRPLAKLAALVMAGRSLAELGFVTEILPRHYSVKEAVFPFVKFPGVDTLLGPEMKSTGEVMGIDSDFGRAFAKSQIQAGNSLPSSGTLLVSIRTDQQTQAAEPVKKLADLGFKIVATEGTARVLGEYGIEVETVKKAHQAGDNTVGRIDSGGVDLVFNSVDGDERSTIDSFSMRRAALQRGIPYCTTLAAARASADAIVAIRRASIGVRSIQEIHASM